ncbi:MAG: alpha-isopropylmalate synthase regulatory domain-containing protein, partial [Candidatus Puniceispirillaceae bacterium]
NEQASGTAAVTRVLIEFQDSTGLRWRTVGVSANIIDASVNALADGMCWKLIHNG